MDLLTVFEKRNSVSSEGGPRLSVRTIRFPVANVLIDRMHNGVDVTRGAFFFAFNTLVLCVWYPFVCEQEEVSCEDLRLGVNVDMIVLRVPRDMREALEEPYGFLRPCFG